ncbi:hypothetical protein AB0E88_24405 [Streptomyces sp. NPDC028635]|uniref:hypothetical protein n=1 Tax=Streptomyces sp. NPDC028635 TaxID=3154800 RepID=UPI0033DBC5A0
MVEWLGFYPCICIAVDAQAYGSNNDRRQSEIQHELPRLLDRAARGAGFDRTRWQIQRKGDEQLAVRPVDGTEARLVDDYVRHLAAVLREHNAQRVREAQTRLRVVVHQGLVELADNGFAGAAVVATARLLNAPALYDALSAHPGADLVVLLSDEVFASQVVGGHTTLRTEDFTRVAVQVKEYRAAAWLHIPGAPVTVAHEPGSAEPGESAAPASVLASEPAVPVSGESAVPASDPASVPVSGEPAADRSTPAVAGGSAGISNEYRAGNINVNNMSGPVDARGAVFGFGSPGA